MCARRGGKRRQRGREGASEREGREGASGSQERRAGGGDEEVGARRRARAGGSAARSIPARSAAGAGAGRRRARAEPPRRQQLQVTRPPSPRRAWARGGVPGQALVERRGAPGGCSRFPVVGWTLTPGSSPGPSACGLRLTLDQSLCRRDSVSFCDSRGWRPGNAASRDTAPVGLRWCSGRGIARKSPLPPWGWIWKTHFRRNSPCFVPMSGRWRFLRALSVGARHDLLLKESR